MKRKDDFLLQNVSGENFLIPIGAAVMDLNGIITLNETGAYIWEMLATDRNSDELATAVEEKFGIDHFTAQRDVEAFLDEIRKLSLLE